MARYQIRKRGWFTLDMAAFCSIGFMLLCYLMLTQKPLTLLYRQLNIPEAKDYVMCDMQDAASMRLVIIQNKCFVMLPDCFKRVELEQMAKKKRLSFSATDIIKFHQIPGFGIPINKLKAYVNSYRSLDDMLNQSGVPVNRNTDNELNDWIQIVKATSEKHHQKMKVEILSDQNVSYAFMRIILDNLKRHKINRYTLLVKPYYGNGNDNMAFAENITL